MGTKIPIEVPSFQGINKLHTRQVVQLSEGKNFWTKNGVLTTRKGCTPLAGGVPKNLCPNPSFEANTSSWNYQDNGGTGSFSRDTSTFNSGTASGKLSKTGTNGNVRAYFALTGLTPGRDYPIEAMLKSQIDGGITIYIEEETPDWQYLQAGKIVISGLAGKWTKAETSFKTTQSGSTIYVFFEARKANIYDSWIDDVFVYGPSEGGSFQSTIRSIHKAKAHQITGRLIVEADGQLWVRTDGANTNNFQKLAIATGNSFCSTQWNDKLVLASGSKKYVYDIKANGIDEIVNMEEGASGKVPDMEMVTTYKGYVFGWAPNYPDGSRVYFNGYEKDADGFILAKSLNYWPPDFYIDVSKSAGDPVIACLPFQTHLLILTKRGTYRIYGENEDTFEVTKGGNIGVFDVKCAFNVGDAAIWFGDDRRVYGYTGSTAYPISQPIEELLQLEKAWPICTSFEQQFWLMFPDRAKNTTNAYVYDVTEKSWFIHKFPFQISSAGTFDDGSSEETLHFGTQDGKVLRVGVGDTDSGIPIETEFVIGPLEIESRIFKAKTLWLNAEPHNDFELKIVTKIDDRPEIQANSLLFKKGDIVTGRVKFKGVKGRNISFHVSTLDKINELQKATLTVIPRKVK